MEMIIHSALQGSHKDNPSYMWPNSRFPLLTGDLLLTILGWPLVKWNIEIIQITSLTAQLRRKWVSDHIWACDPALCKQLQPHFKGLSSYIQCGQIWSLALFPSPGGSHHMCSPSSTKILNLAASTLAKNIKPWWGGGWELGAEQVSSS